jgi:cell cycle sensor histidine kinase DivJ
LVADKRSLSQIMLNLVSNAIKFTRCGGKITVSARVDADNLAVLVEDTGVGIGAEDLPRIGDPFFQARSSYDRHHDGTGLGLSIVKGLLGLHGGDIAITSKLGEGTRVTIRLPLDCEAARKRRETASTRQPDQNNTEDASDIRVRISA